MSRKKLCLTCPSHFPSRLALDMVGLQGSKPCWWIVIVRPGISIGCCLWIHAWLWNVCFLIDQVLWSFFTHRQKFHSLLFAAVPFFLLFAVSCPHGPNAVDLTRCLAFYPSSWRSTAQGWWTAKVLTAARLAAAESTLLLEPFHGVYACVCNAAESDLDLNDRCSGLLLLRWIISNLSS